MAPIPPHRPRVITYYQTHHDPSGKFISVLPLVNGSPTGGPTGITHVILAAIHINEDPAAITLNDHPPSHPRFDTLWAELRVLQATSVTVMGMLGGAAAGTYARLGADDATFEIYYAPLRDLIRQRGLDGLDLDVEEKMSLSAAVRLVDRLRRDFGPGFVISFAPVAAALLDPRANLSGFDYEALEVMRGAEISFYNAQFYCGWGSAEDAVMYQYIMAKGWPPEKVVVGLVTNPENGSGFVDWERLGAVVAGIAAGNPRFGGVMGWEYFNSLPGGRERPWEWAAMMGAILGGGASGVEPEGQGKATGLPGHLVIEDEGEDEEDSAPVPAPFTYFSDSDSE
ncbi:related to chitinase [Cephalotrichum gorgonifer]|uniref:chitinase n=1 Tax=Cephalotrichum gorgonifer TaxID=2041049 RepID=A0AAE8N5V6_9PEZI|nr:related to chitinase [Cephalotrichum gorgonifer]